MTPVPAGYSRAAMIYENQRPLENTPDQEAEIERRWDEVLEMKDAVLEAARADHDDVASWEGQPDHGAPKLFEPVKLRAEFWDGRVYTFDENVGTAFFISSIEQIEEGGIDGTD